LLRDYRNPHTLGLEAREVFFLEDNIVIVEGQEDVWFYKHTETLNEINGNFFGWGAGGAEKIRHILDMLIDLGFKKIAVILDNDKTYAENGHPQSLVDKLREEYEYNGKAQIFNIPTDDIRDKDAQKAQPEKVGLVEKSGADVYKVKEEYQTDADELVKSVNEYFSFFVQK